MGANLVGLLLFIFHRVVLVSMQFDSFFTVLIGINGMTMSNGAVITGSLMRSGVAILGGFFMVFSSKFAMLSGSKMMVTSV